MICYVLSWLSVGCVVSSVCLSSLSFLDFVCLGCVISTIVFLSLFWGRRWYLKVNMHLSFVSVNGFKFRFFVRDGPLQFAKKSDRVLLTLRKQNNFPYCIKSMLGWKHFMILEIKVQKWKVMDIASNEFQNYFFILYILLRFLLL